MIHRTRLPFLVLLLMLSLTGRVFAAEITPTDVYQATEEFRLELLNLGLIDNDLYMAEPYDKNLRHPRHVMQKVRECHTLLSKLLKKEGVEISSLPKPAVLNEIRPQDVKNGVEHLIQGVRKIGGEHQSAPRPSERKYPNDVYNNLKRICHAMNVEIEPADMYQIAVAVSDNTERIAKARGYEISITQEERTDVTQAELYESVWRFLDDLRALALNPDFAIPGGIIIPNRQETADIKMQDIMALMNDAMSGTDAVKYTLQLREVTEFPPYEENKNIADIYNLIAKSDLTIREILRLEIETEKELAK